MKITNIDFEQSLLRKRLMFRSSCVYKFDLVFQIIVNLILCLCMGINFIEFATYDRNAKSFLYAIIIFILIFNYLLYLKLTEKRLSVFRTGNPEAVNRDRILTFANQEDWSLRKK